MGMFVKSPCWLHLLSHLFFYSETVKTRWEAQKKVDGFKREQAVAATVMVRKELKPKSKRQADWKFLSRGDAASPGGISSSPGKHWFCS